MGTVFTSQTSQPRQPISYERLHSSVTERAVDVVFSDVTHAGHDLEAAEALRVFASEYTALASELFEDDRDLTNSIAPRCLDHL